ncbi:hypothetical protein JCM10207_002658 [Rhodosporidiobolus poonsookiae]
MKSTKGLNCAVELTVTGTSAAIFGGSTKTNGLSWSCSLDFGSAWKWQSHAAVPGDGEWDLLDLCSAQDFEPEYSQSLWLQNGQNTTLYFLNATVSGIPSTGSSNSASASVSESASASSTSLNPSATSSSSTSSLGSSTLIFATVVGVVLAIVILCLFVALCFRTKPAHGREEAGIAKRARAVSALAQVAGGSSAESSSEHRPRTQARSSMSTDGETKTYGLDDAFLYFTCPSDVAEEGQWKDQKFDKHGTPFVQVKTASGKGCTAQLIVTGTSAKIFGGSDKNDGMAWGCTDNYGATYDGHSHDAVEGEYSWDFLDLCTAEDLDTELSQSLWVQNQQDTTLYIFNATVTGIPSNDTLSSSSSASSSTKASATSTSSTPSSSAVASTSAVASSSVATTQSEVQSTALSTSLSPSATSSSSDDSLGSNTVVFASIIGVVLAIVILCLIVALCFRTKPAQGREEAGIAKRARAVSVLAKRIRH